MRYLTAAGGMTNVHGSSTAPALRSRLVRIDSRGKIADRRFDISRSSVSKTRRVFRMWMDKAFLYLAEVLRVQVQELFPTRPLGNRIYDFIEKLETTRF
jgi:hypothetical protein